MKVLIINPGATSTKIAVFDEDTELFKQSIDHDAADLAPFSSVIDQKEYRKALIMRALADAGYKMTDFAAVCGRGGLLRHIPSGTYTVTQQAVEDITTARYGEHASNLGALLAKELGDTVGIPSYFVDPVCTDEFTDIARVSGFAGMERQSFFHALNHKAMAREAAKRIGKAYEALNLIVVHMGGGVSVALHEKGRVVDAYNVRDEGAFSMDRGGSLPIMQVIDLCFSGKDKKAVKKLLASGSGVYSYCETRDFREVVQRMEEGDATAALVSNAMVYQLAKDIGAMATVACCEVDAIVLTGGMANSKWLCTEIEKRVGKLAPVMVLPGENEMQSLALGALRVLHGEQAAKTY
ncbi:MAG: butyrate kinase [Clostridia bacterium]|nr:butyrate kinase [Clostridia bacterium]